MTVRDIVMSSAGASGAPANYIEDVFSTWLYAGTGSTQTITNGIDLAGKGGLVWTKARNDALSHTLIDTNRGLGRILSSNSTGAQSAQTADTLATITGFTSSGYTLGTDAGNWGTNFNGYTYASWTFRKQPKFFDVVTFSTNASGGTDSPVAHALASTPGCIIIKSLSTGNWFVWHRAMNAATPNRYRAILNSTFQAVDEGAEWIVPTSTNFNITNSVGILGASQTYVAYLFAHNAGGFGLTGTDNVISCGSVTDNNRVELGYEPQFLLMKKVSGTGNWILVDTMRGLTANTSVGSATLFPNTTGAEASGTIYASIDATGFTSSMGAPGTHIYIAIRRGPMKTPTTGTSVFAPNARTGTGASSAEVTNISFPPDMSLTKVLNANNKAVWFDRLRGPIRALLPSSTDAEQSIAGTLISFNMNGISIGNTGESTYDMNYTRNYVDWFFRRAPGFMDVRCYTGTGSARTVAHNLGVAPELMIVKSRSLISTWPVYTAATGATNTMDLSSTGAATTLGAPWSGTSPTASVFTISGGGMNTSDATYVAYLFASCPGVSKVGSYTGNGSSQTINCGFAAGARFVMVKRTDAAGDWYIWDTARGIVASNDPHLSLNSTAAEVTTNDSVDPVASGFAVNQVAATNINVSGASYIYLAIA